MDTKQTNIEKVTQIISKALHIEENKITPQSRLVEDLGADSLDQVELILALEEHFGCEIPDEDASKLTTIADVAEYIAAKSLPPAA